MTRTECENKIMEHLKAIKEIAEEFDPGIEYMNMSFGTMDADYKWSLSVNNRYWELPADKQIYYTLWGNGKELRNTFVQEAD